jgi:hypothetical protein
VGSNPTPRTTVPKLVLFEDGKINQARWDAAANKGLPVLE